MNFRNLVLPFLGLSFLVATVSLTGQNRQKIKFAQDSPAQIPVKFLAKIPRELKGTLVIAGVSSSQKAQTVQSRFPLVWARCDNGEVLVKRMELAPVFEPDNYVMVKYPVFSNGRLFLHYIKINQTESGTSSTFDFKIDEDNNPVPVSKFPIGSDILAHTQISSLKDGTFVFFNQNAFSDQDSTLSLFKVGKFTDISSSFLSDRFSTTDNGEVFFSKHANLTTYPSIHSWSQKGGIRSLRLPGYAPEVTADGKWMAYFAPVNKSDKTFTDTITTVKSAIYAYGPDATRTKVMDLYKNFPQMKWIGEKSPQLLVLTNSYSYSSKMAKGEIKTYDPVKKLLSKAIVVSQPGLASLTETTLLLPEFTLCGIANDKYAILQVESFNREVRKKKFLAVDLKTGERSDLAEVDSDNWRHIASAAWIDG